MARKTSRKTALVSGSAIIWPAGIEQRYGVSACTRWRWERDKKLPTRDVHVGGRSGWKLATLEAFEAGNSAARSAS